MKREEGSRGCGSPMDTYEERRKQIQRFNLTSDVFFGKVLEEREACQEAVRILLGRPELIVKNVKAQYSIRNVENHSVVLDILAETRDGVMVNVEMQIANDGDHQRRARYYISSMDASFLEKGMAYEKLPDIYLIYITEKDFMDQRTGICHVDRRIRETGSAADNGVHEIYANLTCRCGDRKLDELLAYFKKSDSHYETEYFPNIVRRVRFFKEQKEGVDFMCEILEEERKKGIAEGKAEGKAEGIAEGKAELISIIRKKVTKGLGGPEIAEQLELDGAYVKLVTELLSEEPGRTDLQVAEALIARE